MFYTIVSHTCSTVTTAKESGARTLADTGLQRDHTTDPQMIKRVSEGATKPRLPLPFLDAHETPLAHFLAQPILINFLDAFCNPRKGAKTNNAKHHQLCFYDHFDMWPTADDDGDDDGDDGGGDDGGNDGDAVR